MQLTEKQLKGLNIAVTRFKEKKSWTVISGYAGSGKAQPNDTLIPTPAGDKRIGELKIGDFVYDRFGHPTEVLNVFPQGLLDSYIVTFEDGRTTRCNDEHIFSYYTSRGNLANKTIRQMLDAGIKYNGRNGYKFKVPVFQGIEYEEKQYSIDPYVIGVLLGDGCCKQRMLTISSENDEIPNEIGRLIGAKPKRQSNYNYNWIFEWNKTHYTISKKVNRTYIQNRPQTLDFLSEFHNELCCGAEEKRIPLIYMKGSKEQRYSLLQGLFDTDGSIQDDGLRFNIKYTSINLNLIKDIQKILYELGFKSTISKDKREKYTTSICYSLNVNMPNEEKYHLFRLKRKREIAEKAKNYIKRKDYSKMAIIDIQKEECQREMTCIYVDNAEHLYVTNDYIVTHNTTLVRFIIEALDIKEKQICFACYTGKAAEVLRKKGNRNAITLHKLLYDSIPKPDGTFIRKKKRQLDYKLIIVDECSMVPKEMVEQLSSYRGVHTIYLGDPFQIPPISEDSDNHLLDNPHCFLDEIMRQAKESEIIQVSMDIRNNVPLSYMDGSETKILPRSKLNSGMLLWADQIIVATNKTRKNINSEMRQILHKGSLPEDGDKIICNRNYWDVLSEKQGNPIINGSIGYLKDSYNSFYNLPYWCNSGKIVNTVCGKVETDYGEIYDNLQMDRQLIITGQKSLTSKNEYLLARRKMRHMIPLEFEYGYAITCHKAQGSQWSKVLVIEENFPFSAEEHARWLYTAVTRASDKLVIIKK